MPGKGNQSVAFEDGAESTDSTDSTAVAGNGDTRRHDTPPPATTATATHRAGRAKDWLWANRFLLMLLATAGTFFLYWYYQSNLRPGSFYPLGFHGWYDQGEYMKAARAIRAWDLAPKSNYAYPMGYPMAAAPFTGLIPADPFLPVNFVSFLAVFGLFFETARRWVGKPIAFVGGILLLLATPITLLTAVPWTSTPALLAVTYWMYVTLGRRRITYPGMVIGSLLIGWMYMSRGGGELILLGPFALAILWTYRREPGLGWKLLIGVSILAVVFVGNALWTHAIFGQWFHPYLNAVKKVGFDAGFIPGSLWGTLFVGGDDANWYPALFVQAFWFLAFPFGVYLACKRRDAVLHLGLIGSVVVGWLVVCAFDNFGAEQLKFYGLHYVKLWFPAMALYALIALRRFLDNTPPGAQPGTQPATQPVAATRARSSS